MRGGIGPELSSRRVFIVRACGGFASIALSNDPVVADEPSALSITTKSGRSFTLSSSELRYYYGRNSYYERIPYNGPWNGDYTTKLGQIRLILQGWLFLDYPIDRISSINRLNSRDPEEARKQGNKGYRSIEGFSYGASDFFEVVLTDGSHMIANMGGVISGTAKNGVTERNFSAEAFLVESITMTGSGAADFRLRSGAVQTNVSRITMRHDGPQQSRKTPAMDIVVESPSGSGGICVTLGTNILAERTVTFTREVATKGGFKIVGLSDAIVDGEIAWIDWGKSTFHQDLAYLGAACIVNEIPGMVFVRLDQVQAMAISAERGATAKGATAKGATTEATTTPATTIKSLTVRSGDTSTEFSDLHDPAFWYLGDSPYNFSDTRSSFAFDVGPTQTEVKLADIRALSVDAKGKTTLELRNGESHSGTVRMDSGKPLAIVGSLAGGYGGFAATACFVLSEIASLRYLSN